MLRIATRARERVKSRGRKRRASVSVIEGAFPIRFPARANKQTNKQTNEESSSRKKRRKEDKEERCVVSHLFTRDGEHDRADAGRTSYAHSEE